MAGYGKTIGALISADCGFADVLWTRLRWQGAIAILAFLSWWLVLFLNYTIAQRLTRDRTLRVVQNPQWDPYLPSLIRYISLGLITLLALTAAVNGLETWEGVIRFLHPVDFGHQDPLYGRDIGFYIFRLPLYERAIGDSHTFGSNVKPEQSWPEQFET
ncbi:MAG: UPF0182 family protein, partial [Pseudomonadota bacterium]